LIDTNPVLTVEGARMLVRFVYLDEPTLADYAAQIDGGLIAETKTRQMKKRSTGGQLGTTTLGIKAEGGAENEHSRTYSDTPGAQFHRLLAAASANPEALAWTEVMQPAVDFENAQVGELIQWDCDVDIPDVSRLVARDGGVAKLLEFFPVLATAMAQAGRSGPDAETTPEPVSTAQHLAAQSGVAKQLIEGFNAKRMVVGEDSDIEWKVFGSLDGQHVRVDDISAERLIVVGKVKRLLPRGESRRVVEFVGLPTQYLLPRPQEAGSGAQQNRWDQDIVGPALELDILAIYR
jgi:hypothetical protein